MKAQADSTDVFVKKATDGIQTSEERKTNTQV